MELYQFRSFLAVAEEQHLTRAAERLHLSQPSVSTHISALEEELGLKLFIRTPKGMILSKEGKSIRSKVEFTVQAANAVLRQADQLRNEITGEARIGLNIDAQYLKASDLHLVLHKNYPKLELHFSQCHTLEAHEKVKNGQLDAAFVFKSPKNSDLEVKWLATIGVVIVAPYQWKDRLLNISLGELAELPWIWTDDRCPFNRITKQLFEPLSHIPAKSMVVDHDTTIRKMVGSCAGIGLMVESEAYEAAQQKQVVILGDRVSELDLSLLYLSERSTEPLVKAIITSVSKLWSGPSNESQIAAEKIETLPLTMEKAKKHNSTA